MRSGRALIVLVSLALVVGCGSSSGTKAATPSVSPIAHASTTASPTPSTKPTPTPKPAASELATQYPDKVNSMTFFGYEQPVAVGQQGLEPAGTVFGAVDVRVCIGKEGTVSQAPWALHYADGSQALPLSASYSWNPQPVYPFVDTLEPAGSCVRGKIMFPVQPGNRPTSVTYSPGNEFVLTWKITR